VSKVRVAVAVEEYAMQYSTVDVYEGNAACLAASFIWVIPIYVVFVTPDESSR
jgi:hypothetical protein